MASARAVKAARRRRLRCWSVPPDTYDKGFLHCDVLIIGAGPAGLAAALAAGRAGARVILADEDFRLGGRLLSETHEVAGDSGAAWADHALEELDALDNVRLLPRTTVYGAYDHGIYGALERKTDLAARAVERVAALRALTGDDREYTATELELWESILVLLARATPDEVAAPLMLPPSDTPTMPQ